jgi:hypothetical protein
MRSLIVAVLLALARTLSGDTGYLHVYPSMTHAPGVGGSIWRSSLSLVNGSTLPVVVEADNYLALHTVDWHYTVPPGTAAYFDDIVSEVGLPEGTYALQFTVWGPNSDFAASRETLLVAKTYNVLKDGQRMWTALPEKTWGVRTSIRVPFDQTPGFRNRLYVLYFGTTVKATVYGASGVLLSLVPDQTGLVSYRMPPEALYAIVERTDGKIQGSDLDAYSTATDNVSGDTTVIR